MKNLKIIASVAALAVSSFANAQSLSIYAEFGEIIAADGTTVIDAVTSGWTGYFGFVPSATDLSVDLGSATDISLDYLTTVNSVSWTSLVALDPGGGGWFLSPNGTAFDPTLDLTPLNSDLAVGTKPVILFTDAATVGGIGAGSQLILAEGAPFLSAFDNRSSSVLAGDYNAIAGLNSSLQAGIVAAPVPEPSTFALLGGIAALGLVMYRRRRA